MSKMKTNKFQSLEVFVTNFLKLFVLVCTRDERAFLKVQTKQLIFVFWVQLFALRWWSNTL